MQDKLNCYYCGKYYEAAEDDTKATAVRTLNSNDAAESLVMRLAPAKPWCKTCVSFFCPLLNRRATLCLKSLL